MPFSTNSEPQIADLLTGIKKINQEFHLYQLPVKLLEVFREVSNANCGFLFSKVAEQWFLKASFTNSELDTNSCKAENLKLEQTHKLLPIKLIYHVIANQKGLLLNNTDRDKAFNNLLPNSTKSVLCLPLLHKNDLLGIAYLENDLINAFTTKYLAVLEILSIHAAISLHNQTNQEFIKSIVAKLKLANVELEQAKDAAKVANTAKNTFLANMSHEIRTPMNAIVGFTHLALQNTTDAQQKDYLEKINTSSQSLLKIVNDILDFAKIEAGKIEIIQESFFLKDVLQALADMFELEASQKDLELLFKISSDVPISLVGDILRLKQLLANLVSNAIKFTEIGSIIVSINNVNQTNNKVTLEFSVQDTGIGISTSQLTKLFKPFSQIDQSLTRRHGGTGLGLIISKRLSESMGGEIVVESILGKGSTFSFKSNFSLPAQTRTLGEYSGNVLQEVKVLVVDDSQASRAILQHTLKTFNCALVTTVTSGNEAWAKIALNHYDIILLDYQMPNLNGIEFTRRLKAHFKDNKLPKFPTILMISAYREENILKQAKETGVDGFLVKPINPSVLFDMLVNLLKINSFQTPDLELNLNYNQLLTGIKVLLVEDSTINKEMLVRLLQTKDIKVSTAQNGKEALEILNQKHFDIVLMDIHMPIMDGYTATHSIRQNPQFKDLPIIAMTANALSEDIKRYYAVGMNAHLTKPINIRILFQTIAQWTLGKTHQNDSQNELLAKKPRDGLLELTTKPTTVESAAIFSFELPNVNIEQGIKYTANDPGLYSKILKSFGKDYANFVEQINNQLSLGNLTEVLRQVHTFKGLAATLGAFQLAESAEILEIALQEDRDDVKELLERINDLLEPLVQTINNLKELKPSVNQDKNIASLIKNLLDLLAKSDTAAVEYFSRLESSLSEYGENSTLKKLSELVQNYDFEQAYQTLLFLCDKLTIELN